MSADHPEDTNHGDTIAAWSAVVVIVLGFLGLVVFFYIGDLTLTWVSIAVIGAGAILGPILSALGFGKKR